MVLLFQNCNSNPKIQRPKKLANRSNHDQLARNRVFLVLGAICNKFSKSKNYYMISNAPVELHFADRILYFPRFCLPVKQCFGLPVCFYSGPSSCGDSRSSTPQVRTSRLTRCRAVRGRAGGRHPSRPPWGIRSPAASLP